MIDIRILNIHQFFAKPSRPATVDVGSKFPVDVFADNKLFSSNIEDRGSSASNSLVISTRSTIREYITSR